MQATIILFKMILFVSYWIKGTKQATSLSRQVIFFLNLGRLNNVNETLKS